MNYAGPVTVNITQLTGFEIVRGTNNAGDTLVGNNNNNTWTLSEGPNQGCIAGVVTAYSSCGGVGIQFSRFENLTGGTGLDSFYMLNNGSVGTINGGTGGSIDVIDYSSRGATVTVNLATNSVTGVTQYIAIERIVGSSVAGDALNGSGNDTTWTINGVNQTSVGGVTFESFETLNGGNGNDRFVLQTNGSISGTISGGNATQRDIMDYASRGTAVTVNLDNNSATDVASFGGIEEFIGGAGVNDTLTGPQNADNVWEILTATSGTLNTDFYFSAFETLNGGNLRDTYIFNDGISFAGAINAGAGSNELDYSRFTSGITIDLSALTGFSSFTGTSQIDTLIGPDSDNIWAITANNAGNINSGAFDFSGFENLTGGDANDEFIFNNGVIVTGRIHGGLTDTSGNNIINLSNYTTAATVNLQSATVTTQAGNFDFSNAGGFVGGAAMDTLVGLTTGDTWFITGISGVNSGNTLSGYDYTGFENLTGGNGNDTFIFSANGAQDGLITGGLGDNTLDYSALTQAVSVELASAIPNVGNATGTGGITGIDSIVGSQSSGDSLTGLNANNDWVINGVNAGDVGQVDFSGIENLNGGELVDTFTIQSGGSIQNLGGGIGNDNFTVQAGGSVTAQVTGDDGNDTFMVSGSMQDIFGGIGNDTFTVQSGGSVTGQVFGGDGDDTLIFEYSAASRNIAFDGGAHNVRDTVTLQGSATGQNSVYQFGVTAPDSVSNTIGGQTVVTTGVEQINDQMTADTLTVLGSGNGDTVTLGSSTLSGNNPVSAALGGFTAINSSNKTNLVVDGQDGSDTIDLSGNVNMPSTVTLRAETINNPSASLISASDLVVANAASVGASAAPVRTAVDRLQLTDITGDVYVVENNALTLLNSSIDGSINLANLAGDISANDAITVTGALNITGADSSSVTLNNANNLITGPVSFIASNGVLGSVEFVNNSAVDLAAVNATDLSITANGAITDSGPVVAANQAVFDAAGNDVTLDDAGNDFGALTIANAGQVVVNDSSDLGVDSIAGSLIVVNAGGAITDANSGGINLSGASLQLIAQDGIGSGDALETQVASLQVSNTATGNIGIANAGDLTLVAASNTGINSGAIQISTTGTLTQQATITSNGSVNMSAGGQYSQFGDISVADSAAQINVSSANSGITMDDAVNTTTAGGDISYTASSTVDVSSLDAVYGDGRVEITSFNGDILSTRAPNRARPNVTGGSAFFNADFGTLGTIGRPLVVNVPGAVVINTLTSVDPIYLVSPDPLINQSRVLFGINDAKAEVGGNQRTEVDALAIIDPAIFTKVKNYREDDSPIKLPADQLAEDEEERKYKKKQDPDVFEQEKPFEPESSLDSQKASAQ
ncbi:MAG: hypothetical protein L0Z73_04680 [Gammaproteobacteria bacterium]|nr:hypothetical protein [Gammaproteobacteria bacterium]